MWQSLMDLGYGFGLAFEPHNLFWCFVGVLAGTVIGLLPGRGSTTGVAVLLPLTVTFEPVTALIMLAGIYYGAQYGGTITSVLISTPGEAASVVTTLDGYQMARRGRAGQALAISAISGSKMPHMLGLVSMIAATSLGCWSKSLAKSAARTVPSSRAGTPTTR